MRGSRITFRYRGKHRVRVRTAIVDAELAAAMKELLARPRRPRALPLPRRTARSVHAHRRTAERVHRASHMGEEFTAKDFRTLGRDAARRDRARGARPAETRDRGEAQSSRQSCERSGSSSETRRPLRVRPTSARPSSSSISTAERSTIFGRAICASSARAIPVSIARSMRCSSLLRSWRIRRARACRVNFLSRFR